MEKAASKYLLWAVILFSKEWTIFHKWEDSSLASLRDTVGVDMSESIQHHALKCKNTYLDIYWLACRNENVF